MTFTVHQAKLIIDFIKQIIISVMIIIWIIIVDVNSTFNLVRPNPDPRHKKRKQDEKLFWNSKHYTDIIAVLFKTKVQGA